MKNKTNMIISAVVMLGFLSTVPALAEDSKSSMPAGHEEMDGHDCKEKHKEGHKCDGHHKEKCDGKMKKEECAQKMKDMKKEDKK